MAFLTITGYSDEKFSQQAPAPHQFVAMLNPENIKHDRAVDFSQTHAGAASSAPKFDKMPSETLSFDLVIDCTGVVDATRVDLKAELDTLSAVVHDYKSETHRPNFVVVAWGDTLNFRGVLTGMSTSFTFFRPDGSALRAKVGLSFKSYVDPGTQSRSQNPHSPDVTHRIMVREGDSLPLIAHQVYRDPRYFVALAKANGLDKFRRVAAGVELLTPPLKSMPSTALPSNGTPSNDTPSNDTPLARREGGRHG
jgi:nucleoid-associated protein YgaU